MRSIRFFLVASILATLTLFNFVAVLQGYRSSMNEADVLFDNQLMDIALLVANVENPAAVTNISLENEIIFQVFDDDSLIMASSNAPQQALPVTEAGFDYTNFDGYRWRTFVLADTNRKIIVAERTDLRFILAENVVLESVVPILLGIPLVGLIIWTIVSLSLRPLKELSAELKQKQAQDLSTIQYKNTTQELAQVIESTNSFISRLGEVLEREKRFSADAAHELRTPISALKIQLHNLRDEIGSENESFQQLQSGVERMQHLIEQLLSLYRTTPEKFTENYQTVDLYQIAQEQIARSYSSFENKDQTLELEGDHTVVKGEPFALETLLSNLLSNANKYTPVHGNILVRVSSKGSAPVLSVEDNGPGIPEQDRKRIFDRFYRSQTAQGMNAVPGCGLGLTIVSHIATLHQAKVIVEDSCFDTGTAVRICFGGKA